MIPGLEADTAIVLTIFSDFLSDRDLGTSPFDATAAYCAALNLGEKGLPISRFVFVAILLACSLVQSTVSSAGPSIVFEAATGDVIHSDSPGAPWYPASLTKLMTAYLAFHAIRDGKLTLKSKLVMTQHAQRQPASKVGMPVGSKITLEKALQVLIVRSANDLAVTIAEGVSGSEEQFVKLMNAWARRLGMTGTYFANPHGLPDPRQVSTARDMGLLAKAIVSQFPEHAKIFKMKDVKIGKRRFRAWNTLLKKMPGADGLKTGFICSSGYNLVGSATRNGRRLVAVVLGAKSSSARTNAAQAALEKGFATNSKEGRTVGDYSNGGLFQSSPYDMKSVVCKRKSDTPLVSPWGVHGWGVEFGRFENRAKAHIVLRENLMALRNIIYTGRGAVVRDYRNKQLASIMYGVPQQQARDICAHFQKSNTACKTFEKGYFKPPKPPKSAKKKKRKKKKKKRARKKKKKKKRSTPKS